MLNRIRSRLNFIRFNIAVREITDTASVECDTMSSAVCVSQVCHRDIFAYLVAIKSLTRFVSFRKIYVIADLSITAKDKDLMRRHVKDVEITAIGNIENKKCPKGGMWERLLFISDRVNDHYVVQLDADTLVHKDIPEVTLCIKDNRSFLLGEWAGQRVGSMDEARENVMRSASEHIQMVSERNFNKLPGYQQLKYVRGGACFAGFSRCSGMRVKIEEFSQSMEKIVGLSRWKEWGSEQVTSNYIIANMPGAFVLPFPKYAGFRPGLDLKENVFLHFIGTHRFEKDVYIRSARNMIKRGLARKADL